MDIIDRYCNSSIVYFSLSFWLLWNNCIFAISCFRINNKLFYGDKNQKCNKKIQHKKPFFSEDPFLIFIIFRLIPGIPYLIKNLSVIFFKLNLKKFFLAVIISDTPQVVIFTFFLKRLIDSSNEFLITQDFNLIFNQMYLPILVLFLFMFFIFFLKGRNQLFIKNNF